MTSRQHIALHYLVRFRNGQDHSAVENSDGSVPVIGSGGVFSAACDYLYDGESVLFGRKGTIDRPLYQNGKFWTVDTMFYTKLGPKVHGRWLYYWATTVPFVLYSTSTALPSMTSATLGRLRVALPSIDEQRKIADFLDRETAKIDALIEKQTAMIALLRERRGSLLEQGVWNVEAASYSLGRTCLLIQTGPFGSQLDANEYVTDGVPVINPQHLFEGAISPNAQVTVSERTAARLQRHRLIEGDVIAARRGQLGRSARVTSTSAGFICGTGSVLLRPNPSFWNSAFLHLAFSSRLNSERLQQHAVGSTMPNLNSAMIASVTLPCPSLDVQAESVSQLEAELGKVDVLIAQVERHIELARERRSALITAAVTGQIDVREM